MQLPGVLEYNKFYSYPITQSYALQICVEDILNSALVYAQMTLYTQRNYMSYYRCRKIPFIRFLILIKMDNQDNQVNN